MMLPLILFFISTIVTIIYVLTLSILRNKKIYKYVEEKIENFDTEKLEKKFDLISSKVEIDNEEFDKIKRSIVDIKFKELNYLNKNYSKFKKFNKTLMFPNFFLFIFNINPLEKKLNKSLVSFLGEYLKLLFEINNYDLSQSIRTKINYNLKQLIQEIELEIEQNANKNIINDSILNEQKKSILQKIEKNSPKDIFYFVEEIKKIFKETEILNQNFDFIEVCLYYFDFFLNNKIIDFKNFVKTKNNAFCSSMLKWKEELLTIKKFSQETKKNLFLLKNKEVEKNILLIEKKINKIIDEANLNKFLYENNENLFKDLKEFSQQLFKELEIIEKETQKYNLKEFDFVELNKYKNIIKKNFIKFIKQKNDFKNFSPLENFNLIHKSFISLNKLNKGFIETFISFSEIINKNNNIKKDLYVINMILLNMEKQIKFLPENLFFEFEKKFEKLQEKTSELIKKDKESNSIQKSKEEKEEILDFKFEVYENYKDAYSITFKMKYLEKLIVILNKYDIEEEYEFLSNDLNKKFNQAKIEESLRVAYKIIEYKKIFEKN